MPANRYYTPLSIEENTLLILDPDESLHLKTVMRNVENDVVEVINGQGYLGSAIVSSIQKKQVILKINRVEKFPSEPDLSIGVGFLVQDRMDLVIEKCCELCATKIELIKTDNVGKGSFTDGQKERMQRVLIAAMKQSGRYHIPKIVYHERLEDFINTDKTIYYADINKAFPPMLDIFDSGTKFKLLVGPAKGFSEQERKKLTNAQNCIGVYLGNSILRAETAAILMAGLASHSFICSGIKHT